MNSQAVVGFLVVFCAFCVPSYLFGRYMGRRESGRPGGRGLSVKDRDLLAQLKEVEERLEDLEGAERIRRQRDNGDIPV